MDHNLVGADGFEPPRCYELIYSQSPSASRTYTQIILKYTCRDRIMAWLTTAPPCRFILQNNLHTNLLRSSVISVMQGLVTLQSQIRLMRPAGSLDLPASLKSPSSSPCNIIVGVHTRSRTGKPKRRVLSAMGLPISPCGLIYLERVASNDLVYSSLEDSCVSVNTLPAKSFRLLLSGIAFLNALV